MATVKRFEDLEVWKASRTLTLKIYELTEKLNKDFSLQNQMRRAAISISSNIAEGFERDGQKEFIQFLAISKGSAGELRSHLYLLFDLKHISESEFSALFQELNSVSKMLMSLINYLKSSDIKGNKFK